MRVEKAQQVPHTRRPSLHVMPEEESGPQFKVHFAVVVHVTMQSVSHLISQFDVSVHATTLPGPRSSLQSDDWVQVPTDPAPALRSHFEQPLQVIRLASPPVPLHSELSPQVMMVDPEPSAWHFDPVWQTTTQLAGPQVVLQSAPSAQTQTLSPAHVHLPPVQTAVGGGESLPRNERRDRHHDGSEQHSMKVRTHGPLVFRRDLSQCYQRRGGASQGGQGTVKLKRSSCEEVEPADHPAVVGRF